MGEQQTYNPDDEEKEKEKDSGKVFDRDLPERPRVGDLKVYPELYARAVSCARAFDVMKGKSYRNAVAIALDRLDDAFFWDVTKEGEQFWRSVDSGGSVKSIVDAYPAQAYLFAV